MGRRILVTGVDSFWGARTAAALEQDPDVELILGMGTGTPNVRLERTEYVRSDQSYSQLSRIVRATAVDTVVHTFLQLDSTRTSGRVLHEINVIGTMNLLAAAGASGSSVRQLVVKSSTLVYGASPRDPRWFSEDAPRASRPRTRLERSLVEVEEYVRDFAEDNPQVVVSVLRFANVLGPAVDTPISRDLARRFAPCIAGFDPMLQFVEEDDVVRSLDLVTRERIPGCFNVAGDGLLPWSEVLKLADARPVFLPPYLTRQAAAPLVQARLVDFPPELADLLRYGRGVDNRRLRDAGFTYRHDSAGAVEQFVRARRLHRGAGRPATRYTYESDVEAFFRHSPAVVVREPAAGAQ
jgi:UDP-glucose 4-epimerase